MPATGSSVEQATQAPPRPTRAAAPRPVQAALARLQSAPWNEVRAALVELAALRPASLPALVAMVDRDDRVPLTDTADLIYPGAKQLSGHGVAINYDLDHLGDRAGWALETLTFHDFGFSDGVPVTGAEDPTKAATRRQRARAAVRTWWPAVQHDWSCYRALIAELAGARPRLAYVQLRSGGAPACEGFTQERFKRDALATVQRHAAAPAHPLHDQARLLLRELGESPPAVTAADKMAELAATTATTTVADLEATLGKPTNDIGSGIHIFVYAIDRAEVRIGSPDGTAVQYIRIIENGRERTLYPAP